MKKSINPLFQKFLGNLPNSILWAGVVFIMSYANLYYFTHKVFLLSIQEAAWRSNISTVQFLFRQAFSLVFLLILSSFCGFAFSKHYGLPEWGQFQELRKRAFRFYLPIAICLGIISYFFFDRWFGRLAPEFYPKNFFWAFSIPFRSAFLEETVFRFGMVTVFVGAIRRWLNPLWAVGIVSLFYSLVISQKTFELVGLVWDVNVQTMIMVFNSFLTHFLLGYVYLKKGLSHSIFLHFLLTLKYPVLSLMSPGG